MSNGHGGARPGAGRKPKEQLAELAELLNEAWPEHERIATIQHHAMLAAAGDRHAFKLLMAYAYGTPVQHVAASVEQTDERIDLFLAAVQKAYGQAEEQPEP